MAKRQTHTALVRLLLARFDPRQRSLFGEEHEHELDAHRDDLRERIRRAQQDQKEKVQEK